MQAVVIDINEADAYLSLPDGTNLNISTTRLPSNIKSGDRIHLAPGNPTMANHRINGLL